MQIQDYLYEYFCKPNIVYKQKGQDAMFIHPDLYIYICISCLYHYCFTVRNLFTIPNMSEWV